MSQVAGWTHTHFHNLNPTVENELVKFINHYYVPLTKNYSNFIISCHNLLELIR